MSAERLQKVLARAGLASRRAAESLITAGRVRVDGRVVSELGTRVSPRARIEVDGRLVLAEPLVYIVLHKPRGVVCTLRDPEGRPTIAEYLKDVGARVVPVGRLDFHTSGALICTNDGELADRLTHPRHHAQKEYVAKVGGVVDERTLERLRERIVIDGRATRPAEVNVLRVDEGKTWISVKLGEGRNRQVRRLGEHAGVPIMRLARVAHAGITAEGLRPGEWRRLSADELRALKAEYGVPRRIHADDPRVAQPFGGRVALRRPVTSGARAPKRGVPVSRDADAPWRREPERGARAPGREERGRGGAPWRETGRSEERGRGARAPGREERGRGARTEAREHGGRPSGREERGRGARTEAREHGGRPSGREQAQVAERRGARPRKPTRR